MIIIIDIPNEFIRDYRVDKFKDFFSRVISDIDFNGFCGNYELEIAEMFFNVFADSEEISSLFSKLKNFYSVDKVVENLNNLKKYKIDLAVLLLDVQSFGCSDRHFICLEDAIEVVKQGRNY